MFQAIIESIFEPGVNSQLLKAVNITFVCLVAVVIVLLIAFGFNIHLVVLLILSIGLLLSVNWWVICYPFPLGWWWEKGLVRVRNTVQLTTDFFKKGHEMRPFWAVAVSVQHVLDIHRICRSHTREMKCYFFCPSFPISIISAHMCKVWVSTAFNITLEYYCTNFCQF